MNKIKLISLLAILLVLQQTPLLAQWTQKTSLAGNARSMSQAFSIGNSIYVIGGNDNNISNIYKDVWEYNVLTDTWTQKADFPGGYRASAVAFSIGNKGYLGTGSNGSQQVDDFWEYDPTSNTWTQKANFPGYPREEAVGFSIGSKGYVGTGQQFILGPNSSSTVGYNDFYEYDPSTNTWTQKANFPGTVRAYATGCGIGSKGYLGMGGNTDQNTSYSDFYEYDPATDTWTPKNGAYAIADASMFVLGTNAYLLGGINFNNFSSSPACTKFNSLTGTWTSVAAFSGGIIPAVITVTANGKAYAGTGFDSNLNTRKDWWEFSAPVQTVVATSISQVPMSGQAISLYPNPVIDQLTVSFNSGMARNRTYTFSLRNLLGQEVASGNLQLEASAAQTLQLPGLPAGIYTFTLNDHGRKIAVRKLIKE